MNILHLKYAVEISKTRSISQAAENLFMGQPNLSRAIKELEESLGITIFERTTKGITVTPDGEEFLRYAKRIISQVEDVEEMYRNGRTRKQKFSACVPRASYISYAFSEFAKHIDTENPAEIFYKETNSMRTINNLSKDEYDLGIVRYQIAFEKYFKSVFSAKKFECETITEFSYVLLMSKDHPLADKDDINPEELAAYVEVTHGDPYVPSMPQIDVKKAEMSEFVDKRIYVFERASQYTLLQRVPGTFMWVSPMPKEILDQYGLVQKPCKDISKTYKDVLIYREGYKLSELDKIFIEEVKRSQKEHI